MTAREIKRILFGMFAFAIGAIITLLWPTLLPDDPERVVVVYAEHGCECSKPWIDEQATKCVSSSQPACSACDSGLDCRSRFEVAMLVCTSATSSKVTLHQERSHRFPENARKRAASGTSGTAVMRMIILFSLETKVAVIRGMDKTKAQSHHTNHFATRRDKSTPLRSMLALMLSVNGATAQSLGRQRATRLALHAHRRAV